MDALGDALLQCYGVSSLQTMADKAMIGLSLPSSLRNEAEQKKSADDIASLGAEASSIILSSLFRPLLQTQMTWTGMRRCLMEWIGSASFSLLDMFLKWIRRAFGVLLDALSHSLKSVRRIVMQLLIPCLLELSMRFASGITLSRKSENSQLYGVTRDARCVERVCETAFREALFDDV